VLRASDDSLVATAGAFGFGMMGDLPHPLPAGKQVTGNVGFGTVSPKTDAIKGASLVIRVTATVDGWPRTLLSPAFTPTVTIQKTSSSQCF